LVVDPALVDAIRAALPELPYVKRQRFAKDYALNSYDAGVLVAERETAEFFEAVVLASKVAEPKLAANWITGNLFGLMNEAGTSVNDLLFGAADLAKLLDLLAAGEVNAAGAKQVLGELFAKGGKPVQLVKKRGLQQISDSKSLHGWVSSALDKNPDQVADYVSGNQPVINWLFGQAMGAAKGKANPNKLHAELEKQLAERKLEGAVH
jgi:aspartyl-tRNA(Asn)/glutamyl-tRNA(Gln) amidotransferase subunit B